MTGPNAAMTRARRLSHRAGTTPGQVANVMARFAYNFDINIAIYKFYVFIGKTFIYEHINYYFLVCNKGA
jgi:hypothetical protein